MKTIFMSIEEIEKLENTRTPQNLNVVYLIKDNENSPWYKAYELSAYYLEFYNKNIADNERLKVQHKQYNNIKLVNVGLQFKSLQKFLPDIQINEENSNNLILQIILPTVPNDLNLINYNEIVQNWKNTIPVKQELQQTQNKKQQTIYSQPTTFSSIMKDIISFSLYNKSEIELVQFIEKLKNKCADLIC